MWTAPLLVLALAPTGGSSDWKPLDAVVGQAGDQVVTRSELRQYVDVRSADANVEFTKPEEYEEALATALDPTLTRELEAQAGADLGLDESRVQRVVRLSMAERRRDLGAAEYRAFLDREGLDAIGADRDQGEALYRSAWERQVVGYDGAVGERPILDRFIRPGELRAIYHTNLPDLGQPDTVRLQDLVIPVQGPGREDEARELAEELRRQALEGADFDVLVQDYGAFAPEALGITEWLPVERIRDDEVRRFSAESELDAYSTVLPFERQGRTVAFHVLKLNARRKGEPAKPFSDRRLQEGLRQTFRNKRDRELLGEARARLKERSYLWVDPDYAPPPAETAQDPPAGRP